MNMKFWQFWTVAVLIVFALAIGHFYFGVFHFILAYDQTYLSFVNIGLLALANILIARFHLKKDYADESHGMIRYISDATVAIGLLGTLIGFMLILWAVFGPGVIIDPTNITTMTEAMTKMAQGMSAALITSLTGIASSILINLQLAILEE
jgi:hypothetical protein